MRLAGKTVLILVTDGVEEEEYKQLRRAFESEYAQVFTTTPQEYLSVESIKDGHRGEDITVDLSFDSVLSLAVNALVIPDGLLSTTALCENLEVLDFVYTLHQREVPIFASGEAARLLYASHVLSEQVVVREGTSLPYFLNQAVKVMIESASYRRQLT